MKPVVFHIRPRLPVGQRGVLAVHSSTGERPVDTHSRQVPRAETWGQVVLVCKQVRKDCGRHGRPWQRCVSFRLLLSWAAGAAQE
jgi:hypothetical protein